jgi:hypothetical protein
MPVVIAWAAAMPEPALQQIGLALGACLVDRARAVISGCAVGIALALPHIGVPSANVCTAAITFENIDARASHDVLSLSLFVFVAKVPE